MAQAKIRFINFDRSPALEFYTQTHLRNLLHRLEGRSGSHKAIEVSYRLDAKAPLGSIKNSEVLVSYRYPGLKKVFIVKKQGTDLRKVLIEAIHVLETQIRRASEKSETGRRTMGQTKRAVRKNKHAKLN